MVPLYKWALVCSSICTSTDCFTLPLTHDTVYIQDELGLSRELMFKLPLEKRWELYLSKQKVRAGTHQKCECTNHLLVHMVITSLAVFESWNLILVC